MVDKVKMTGLAEIRVFPAQEAARTMVLYGHQEREMAACPPTTFGQRGCAANCGDTVMQQWQRFKTVICW